MSRLQVGDKMPNFTFNTGYRTGVKMEDVLDKKTVFWVIRYIGCTVCRYDVHLLASKFDEIKEKGVNLFVVMQSDPKHVQDDLKDTKLPFEIICDDKMEIYKTLDINPALNEEELVGADPTKLKSKSSAAREVGFGHGDYEGDELQLPALFMVETDGTVSYSHYGKDIVDMPSVDELIDML